jgi:hypothetical protein
MQDREDEIQRPDFHDGPVAPPRSNEKSFPLPGVLLLGAIAVGVGSGWFFAPERSSTDPSVPVMAAVSPQDIPVAISTLNPIAQQTAQADSRECRFPMGFITAATPGNPAGGDVVFRTSKYRSPPFHVTDKPQRIAIPNPLPETGGVDLLSADGEAKGLMVSLTPTARMEPVNGTSAVRVIWHKRPACKT